MIPHARDLAGQDSTGTATTQTSSSEVADDSPSSQSPDHTSADAAEVGEQGKAALIITRHVSQALLELEPAAPDEQVPAATLTAPMQPSMQRAVDEEDAGHLQMSAGTLSRTSSDQPQRPSADAQTKMHTDAATQSRQYGGAGSEPSGNDAAAAAGAGSAAGGGRAVCAQEAAAPAAEHRVRDVRRRLALQGRLAALQRSKAQLGLRASSVRRTAGERSAHIGSHPRLISVPLSPVLAAKLLRAIYLL